MKTSSHGPYKWLEADHHLHEFLSLCASAIVGRHIAITAVDSGSFIPSEEDRAAGWTGNGGIAYSPRLESVAIVPPDCCCASAADLTSGIFSGPNPHLLARSVMPMFLKQQSLPRTSSSSLTSADSNGIAEGISRGMSLATTI